MININIEIYEVNDEPFHHFSVWLNGKWLGKATRHDGAIALATSALHKLEEQAQDRETVVDADCEPDPFIPPSAF